MYNRSHWPHSSIHHLRFVKSQIQNINMYVCYADNIPCVLYNLLYNNDFGVALLAEPFSVYKMLLY